MCSIWPCYVAGERKTGDNHTRFTGKIEVGNFGDEFSLDELDCTVSCTSDSSDGNAIREYLKANCGDVIRSKVAEYLRQLREGTFANFAF